MGPVGGEQGGSRAPRLGSGARMHFTMLQDPGMVWMRGVFGNQRVDFHHSVFILFTGFFACRRIAHILFCGA